MRTQRETTLSENGNKVGGSPHLCHEHFSPQTFGKECLYPFLEEEVVVPVPFCPCFGMQIYASLSVEVVFLQ